MSALVKAALDGDWEKARKLQARWLPLMEMNFWESSPGPAKCALSLMKKCGETLRLPLAPVRDETRRKIETLVASLKLAGPRRACREVEVTLARSGSRPLAATRDVPARSSRLSSKSSRAA